MSRNYNVTTSNHIDQHTVESRVVRKSSVGSILLTILVCCLILFLGGYFLPKALTMDVSVDDQMDTIVYQTVQIGFWLIMLRIFAWILCVLSIIGSSISLVHSLKESDRRGSFIAVSSVGLGLGFVGVIIGWLSMLLCLLFVLPAIILTGISMHMDTSYRNLEKYFLCCSILTVVVSTVLWIGIFTYVNHVEDAIRSGTKDTLEDLNGTNNTLDDLLEEFSR